MTTGTEEQVQNNKYTGESSQKEGQSITHYYSTCRKTGYNTQIC